MSETFSVKLAQFPVTLSVEENLRTMLRLLTNTTENEVIVFPEGALSGYDADSTFLHNIDIEALDCALKRLYQEAKNRKLHLIFGSCLKINDQWFNAGLYFGHNAPPFVYHKVNLATSERGFFSAGDRLPTFQLNINGNMVEAGMQLCREIRFPEQWQQLARSGAEVLFYLTNAVGDSQAAPIWRSHLISRAAENQRFVIAVNNAHEAQLCPSMVVTPSGNVVEEHLGAEEAVLQAKVDASEVSNWYLSQARTDIVGQIL